MITRGVIQMLQQHKDRNKFRQIETSLNNNYKIKVKIETMQESNYIQN